MLMLFQGKPWPHNHEKCLYYYHRSIVIIEIPSRFSSKEICQQDISMDVEIYLNENMHQILALIIFSILSLKSQLWVFEPGKYDLSFPTSQIFIYLSLNTGFGILLKNPPTNSGDAGDENFILRWGRSPGKGNGTPLQYSSLRNPRDREAW